MLTRTVEFELKDGRKGLIRNANDGDIDGMLEYLRLSAAESDFIIRYPEECDRFTWENEKRYVDGCNDSENGAMLICTVDGRFVGNCEIQWGGYIKTRHRAEVAIAILKEYWGLGIGSAMFKELIRIAENDPEITQVELDFIEGNTRARALYEKMGFRITGVKSDFIRLKDGSFLNAYSMIRKIER